MSKVLETEDPREAGKTYRSFYWKQNYEVVSKEVIDGITWLTVRWEDYPEMLSTHCTLWDSRDYEVNENGERK